MKLGALTNFTTQFSAGSPLASNGKSLLRFSSTFRAASAPQHVFLVVPGAAPSTDVVDVILLDTSRRRDTDAFSPGLQSIPVMGVSGLMDYCRQ